MTGMACLFKVRATVPGKIWSVCPDWIYTAAWCSNQINGLYPFFFLLLLTAFYILEVTHIWDLNLHLHKLFLCLEQPAYSQMQFGCHPGKSNKPALDGYKRIQWSTKQLPNWWTVTVSEELRVKLCQHEPYILLGMNNTQWNFLRF